MRLTHERRELLLENASKLHSGPNIVEPLLTRRVAADVFFYLALASTALGLGLLAYEGVI
jgi:hypothetical protein